MKTHLLKSVLPGILILFVFSLSARAEVTHAYEGTIQQYGEDWNCKVTITWEGEEGSKILSGKIKIGDHTAEFETVTNPTTYYFEFTTDPGNDDGSKDTYKVKKADTAKVTWSGRRNGKDDISFSR